MAEHGNKCAEIAQGCTWVYVRVAAAVVAQLTRRGAQLNSRDHSFAQHLSWEPALCLTPPLIPCATHPVRAHCYVLDHIDSDIALGRRSVPQHSGLLAQSQTANPEGIVGARWNAPCRQWFLPANGSPGAGVAAIQSTLADSG